MRNRIFWFEREQGKSDSPGDGDEDHPFGEPRDVIPAVQDHAERRATPEGLEEGIQSPQTVRPDARPALQFDGDETVTRWASSNHTRPE